MSGSRRKPNILWICSDQQRWDTLGAYGNPYVRTPNLDKLADRGVLFEHAYSQSTVCTPSRASFLTGRYPRTNRCRQNGQTLPPDEALVTQILARGNYTGGLSGRLLFNADYIAGLAGKLHIAACHPSVRHEGIRDSQGHQRDGYTTFHWSHHPAADWPENEYTQWLHERGLSYEPQRLETSRYVATGMDAEHHQTTWCAQRAIDFITDAAASDRPWLFSVNFFDPHHPFDPPAEYLHGYLEQLDHIPLPRYVEGELQSKPVYQRLDHRAAYNTPGLYPYSEMTADDHRAIRAAYWAMIDLIDAQVGRLLGALQATGQLEDTLVIFMSDHGELLGDHGIYLKGPYFYEESVRVPLIFSRPGTITGGRKITTPVELIDLAPTLLEAAGLQAHPGMQGTSLWPFLTGGAPSNSDRDGVYCEYLNAMPWHKDPPPYATMLRTESHKLVVFHGLEDGELYDLEADPGEAVNRWNDPAYRGVRAELFERLCDRIALTADPLPDREAAW